MRRKKAPKLAPEGFFAEQAVRPVFTSVVIAIATVGGEAPLYRRENS
jgi:hypothetical protein